MMPSTAALGFTLTSAHRMIDRIHRHAAHVWPPALPARATRFPARNVHVIDVADLPDRRVTGLVNAANFPRRQPHQRIASLAVAQRRLLAGAAHQLAAATRH